MPETVDEPEDGEPLELGEEAMLIVDPEDGDRMFLATVLPFLDSYAHDKSLSGRVQHAVDSAVIAICERAIRIAGSDLPPTEDL